jgi:hypothetical protein
MRSYIIERGMNNYWQLTLLEDGEPVGGGVGCETDYDDLVDIATDFCETV